ncbi:hypothetical protein ACQCVH_00525 [Bacillus infantis]|jgi:hypothetical protein|uniref:hypothetical protein n=1 Tax=Bacillus infantis TaxID=324767 RepID=UPI003CF5BA59
MKKLIETGLEIAVLLVIGIMFLGYSVTVYPYEKLKNRKWTQKVRSKRQSLYIGKPVNHA